MLQIHDSYGSVVISYQWCVRESFIYIVVCVAQPPTVVAKCFHTHCWGSLQQPMKYSPPVATKTALTNGFVAFSKQWGDVVVDSPLGGLAKT